jgi:bifunctional non-homologous end joining protein LigD
MKPTRNEADAKSGRSKAKSLESYRAKRKFESTTEPKGEKSAGEDYIFVVQKHRARGLHYDLRLAMGGVLKSWALPRGPSLDPAAKRLAVMVEDHPLEYANFEGVIPKGNYGAGEVIVWDRGKYRIDGDPFEQLKAGKLAFELDGQKLHGRFHLVKTHSAKGNQWLLIKGKDRWASNKDILQQDRSVLSGKRIEELRNPKK